MEGTLTAIRENEWLAAFAIEDRVATPDLYLERDRRNMWGVPHAAAMRAAFDIGIAGFFCIQSIPTVAFLVQHDLDRQQIDRVHKALWNQGLASLLVVLVGKEVRAYSLWQRPAPDRVELADELDHRLLRTLDLVGDAAQVSKLVARIESGSLFEQDAEKFDCNSRIDATLLANLKQTEKLLTERQLAAEAARSLILQTIFIAYLEDRHIIDAAYFERCLPSESVRSLQELLNRSNADLFARLFAELRRNFNGDIFYAPCSFDPSEAGSVLRDPHFQPLAEFRSGLVEMPTQQLRFWPYNFAYIPVELISAIYDRFLNEDDEDRRETGAYYTPRFLADMVVDQLWVQMDDRIRCEDCFSVLDPACGSGIFLVRLFQKIVEEWRRQHNGQPPSWPTLKGFVGRLHGWDKQPSAVRIAAFSLYVALLEQVQPPAIFDLIQEGKMLPPLFGYTLQARDFFDPDTPNEKFDLIVGNPPWVSKRASAAASALRWTKVHHRPMPGNELAWAFMWKSADHLTSTGTAGLLLPAMSFLLNHNSTAEQARRTWVEEFHVLRVWNLADICFQLFEGADRPTALALYRRNERAATGYEFDYWCPKATRLLSAARVLTIASVDQQRVSASSAVREPFFWKRRLWATGRDMRLLEWLSDLPKLGGILQTYGRTRGVPDDPRELTSWIIGQGFNAYTKNTRRGEQHGVTSLRLLTELPHLSAKSFRPWVLPTISAPAWPTEKTLRAGFRPGYYGPRVLVAQGVRRKEPLLRAAYVEQPLTFRHALQAICFPPGERARAKFLTAFLNSRLAAWFCFHTTANLGADRAKVHEEQLRELPFPEAVDLSDRAGADRAESELVNLMDELLERKDELLFSQDWLAMYIERANRLVYAFFGLTKDEITLVEDGVAQIIPSMQPRRGVLPPLLKRSTEAGRRKYAERLVEVLGRWTRHEQRVSARVLSNDLEWSLIELQLEDDRAAPAVMIDQQTVHLRNTLSRVMNELPHMASRNIQLQPDLKVFLDDSLYLVKPSENRYWLESAALNDADDIAGDLLQQKERWSPNP